MLYSRSFRGNIGYQTQAARLHPMYQVSHERFNDMMYEQKGKQHTVSWTRGREHGIQYGGGNSMQDRPTSYQSGSGISMDTIRKTLSALKSAGKMASKAIDVYSGPVGTVLKNKWSNLVTDNPDYRDGFAGEKHMITPKGVSYSFCGPGTAIFRRIDRGDPGINDLDRLCKQHDIDYVTAKTVADVEKADKKLINNIDKTNVNWASRKIVKTLMRAKQFGEKVGALKKGSFANLPSKTTQGKGVRKGQSRDPARKLKQRMKRQQKRAKIDRVLTRIARQLQHRRK